MKKFLFVVVFISLLTLPFQQTFAYSLHGWKFNTSKPTYTWGDRLDDCSSCTLKTAWQNAITSWHGKQSYLRFTYSNSSVNTLNSWYESSSTLYGRMYTTVNSSNNVTKFRGELNAGNTNITKTNVAQSTAVHELGHAMGINHVSGTSIMNTSRDRTKIYTPQTDDVNGLKAIY